MILLIDNYDSFTFNLVQYLGELGCEVVVKRNDAVDLPGIRAMSPSHLVLSPGPCTPNEAGICVAAVRALSGTLPILGVCLGHQSIGQAFGAEVVRAQAVMHGKTSPIFHEGTGLFRGLPAPLDVARYHSLALARGSLPDSLKVTARTEDGEVMAIAHGSHPTFGVQFHPESILTPAGKVLLRNFLEGASC